MTSPPLEILRKFIRFGSLTRPLVYKGIYVYWKEYIFLHTAVGFREPVKNVLGDFAC